MARNGSSKKIKRELECLLTPEELASLAISACEDRDKARELSEEASALNKSAKEKEKQVAEKKIKREVECVDVKIFETNTVEVQRCDEMKYWPEGNKVVETRAMDGEERQTEMDVGPNDGAKTTTKAPAGRGKKKAAEAN